MCADPRPALPVPPLAPFATDRIPEANFRAQEQSMVDVHHERQVRGKHLAISQHDQVEIGKSGREPARHTARQHNRVRTGGNQLARFLPRNSGQPGGRLNHCGTMAHRRETKQRPIFVSFRSAGAAAQRKQANRCNERTAPPRASPRGARPFRFVQLLRSWVWGSRRCLLRERSKSMALHRRQGRRARAAAWWHRSERRG